MVHDSSPIKVMHYQVFAGLCVALLLLVACSGKDNSAGPRSDYSPLAVVSLDTIHLRSGLPVEVDVTIRFTHEALDTISTVDELAFAISYDTSLLAFIEAVPGPAIAGWDYFTWRNMGSRCPPCSDPRVILIHASKDLGIASEPYEPKPLPSGILTRLRFTPLYSQLTGDTCLQFRFYSNVVGANALTGGDGDTYIPSSTSNGIDFGPEYDTSKCGVGGVTCKEAVEFVSGVVCFSDTIRPKVGDIDLDGRPLMQSDAALLRSFFLEGYGVWDDDPEIAAQQVILSDVNRDGASLAVSDLQWIESFRRRNIGLADTGLSPAPDTTTVLVGAQTVQFVALVVTDTPITALWLLLSHPDQDSLIPRWMPVDPNVPSVIPTIEHRTQNRVTRVLIMGWGSPAPFEPEIIPSYYPLTFARAPGSRITLEAAQASTFPGRTVRVQTGTLLNP